MLCCHYLHNIYYLIILASYYRNYNVDFNFLLANIWMEKYYLTIFCLNVWSWTNKFDIRSSKIILSKFFWNYCYDNIIFLLRSHIFLFKISILEQVSYFFLFFNKKLLNRSWLILVNTWAILSVFYLVF